MLHAAHPDPLILASYQRSLDRVYERSREVMETSPSWQAGLYRSLCACYVEMCADPDLLYLHFISTAQDSSVQRARAAHRDRLLALLSLTREDAPPRLHAELLLAMIHSRVRASVAASDSPPEPDAVEQTFATLLFGYEVPPQPQAC